MKPSWSTAPSPADRMSAARPCGAGRCVTDRCNTGRPHDPRLHRNQGAVHQDRTRIAPDGREGGSLPAHRLGATRPSQRRSATRTRHPPSRRVARWRRRRRLDPASICLGRQGGQPPGRRGPVVQRGVRRRARGGGSARRHALHSPLHAARTAGRASRGPSRGGSSLRPPFPPLPRGDDPNSGDAVEPHPLRPRRGRRFPTRIDATPGTYREALGQHVCRGASPCPRRAASTWERISHRHHPQGGEPASAQPNRGSCPFDCGDRRNSSRQLRRPRAHGGDSPGQKTRRPR